MNDVRSIKGIRLRRIKLIACINVSECIKFNNIVFKIWNLYYVGVNLNAVYSVNSFEGSYTDIVAIKKIHTHYN